MGGGGKIKKMKCIWEGEGVRAPTPVAVEGIVNIKSPKIAILKASSLLVFGMK